MPEKSPDFWNLDLSKLTWTGWLLMLITVGTVVGGVAAGIGLLNVLGFQHDSVNNRSSRWMAFLAFIPAIILGVGVFELGRRLFKQVGLPILRAAPQEDSDKPRRSAR